MGESGPCGSVRGEGLFLFTLGELGALDARGADRLQTQLLLVGLFNPLREVWQPVQDAGGGLGFDQQAGDSRAVVAQPPPGDRVAADTGGSHLRLRYAFFWFISG